MALDSQKSIKICCIILIALMSTYLTLISMLRLLQSEEYTPLSLRNQRELTTEKLIDSTQRQKEAKNYSLIFLTLPSRQSNKKYKLMRDNEQISTSNQLIERKNTNVAESSSQLFRKDNMTSASNTPIASTMFLTTLSALASWNNQKNHSNSKKYSSNELHLLKCSGIDGIPSLINDKICHGFNNNGECQFDGMDCCRPIIYDKYCEGISCHCHLDGLYHPTYKDYGCLEEVIYAGDEVCDDHLNTNKCGFDLGDCCLPNGDFRFCINCSCNPSLVDSSNTSCLNDSYETLGNAICDSSNNVMECNFDHGDCCRPLILCSSENCSPCHETHITHMRYEGYGCEALYNQSIYGLGVCNDELNNKECFYDNGDCCLEVVNTSFCTECMCHLTNRIHKPLEALWGWLGWNDKYRTKKKLFIDWGDGRCDSSLNVKIMNYDGGDCCLTISSIPRTSQLVQELRPAFQPIPEYGFVYNSEYLEWQPNSFCHATKEQQKTLPDFKDLACATVYRDGICDDSATVDGCFLDGGDCCLPKIIKIRCSECICNADNKVHLSYQDLGCEEARMGDGFCDDDLNVETCNFDMGDCCPHPGLTYLYEETNVYMSINDFYCEECICKRPSLNFLPNLRYPGRFMYISDVFSKEPSKEIIALVKNASEDKETLRISGFGKSDFFLSLYKK